MLRSQSATKLVIVSRGMFTSYFFEPFFGILDLEKKSINAIGGWETAVTLTTPDDIGILTAQIFFTEPEIENEIVYIAGDTITYGDLADIAESLSGQKYERTLSDIKEITDDLKNDPTNFVKKYRSIFGAGRGVSWPIENTFNGKNGIPTTSAKQWGKENIDWEFYN